MLSFPAVVSRFSRFFLSGKQSLSSLALPDLVKSINSVTEGEIDRAVLHETVKLNPNLLDYDLRSWQRVLQTLKNQGFPSYMLLPLIVNYPTILHRTPEQIKLGLDKWHNCQFGERNVMKLVTRYPMLLDIPNDESFIMSRIASLQEYAETRKNVWTMFMNSPNLITDKIQLIHPKINYLQSTMRVHLSEVLKTEVFTRNLFTIRSRHVFLERLGIYKAKSIKEDLEEINKNPKLHQIMDTSDKTFATKVAFATLEEFEVFKELYSREVNEEDDLLNNNDEE
ncbi:transcription termination factor 4, mitochondrial [Lutzomyia longipalpis]|uniref:transcription termination factor 4, mitochondrial n=1 Tax=Lutzomyia longipalpis TaxID=7200 RepID=UPI002483F2A4|nr:transcription termination factor 4, mitochondrial [Lutzomyia longipalpis]